MFGPLIQKILKNPEVTYTFLAYIQNQSINNLAEQAAVQTIYRRVFILF